MSDFDESYYLTRYSDVANAVGAGLYGSGRDHFELRGKKEGRAPNSSRDARANLTEGEKVLQGKNGWLFLQNDSNRVLEQISGRYKLPPNFERQWRKILAERQNFADQLGFKYAFAVAPNKECVYCDMLPDNIALSQNRPILRVANAAERTITFSYMLKEVLAARPNGLVFPKGDTHWNIRGAYPFYSKLMEMVSVEPIAFARLRLIESDFPGDLAGKLGSSTTMLLGVMTNPTYRVVADNGLEGQGKDTIFENPKASGPSCVIFRDSFCNALIPLLAQTFRRLRLVTSPRMDRNLLEQEQPAIVITEVVERFLVALPEDK